VSDIELWSSDRRFGLRLSHSVLQELTRYSVESGSLETGGVLIGHYSSNLDCAVIDEITGPPEDSIRRHSWFVRGIQGLVELLHARWHDARRSYLGEWHYHPAAQPDPSGQDLAAMRSVAMDRKAQCPQPLIVVMSRDGEAHRLTATVVPGKGAPVRLSPDIDPEPYVQRQP
jgi:integrative and conjugative element protein (TIGR02256 family)